MTHIDKDGKRMSALTKVKIDHSNTVDSKESKIMPSTSNISAYMSSKRPAMSHYSFMTFHMSKDGSTKLVKELDEMSNVLSFGGNINFGIKQDQASDSPEKFKGFEVNSDKHSGIIHEEEEEFNHEKWRKERKFSPLELNKNSKSLKRSKTFSKQEKSKVASVVKKVSSVQRELAF